MRARVEVTGICAGGWFARNLSLREWAMQRRNLERCEVLFVCLMGSLCE